MIIGLGTGGGYDLWARTVARSHRPPPAGQSDRDRAEHGRRRQLPCRQLHGEPSAARRHGAGADCSRCVARADHRQSGAQFDPTKFSWLGTTTTETNVCIAYKTASVKTVQDLMKTGIAGRRQRCRHRHRQLSEGAQSAPRTSSSRSSAATDRPPTWCWRWSAARSRAIARAWRASSASGRTGFPRKTVNVLFQGGVKPNPVAPRRALHQRPREDRGRPARDRVPLCRAGDRAAILRAARRLRRRCIG